MQGTFVSASLAHRQPCGGSLGVFPQPASLQRDITGTYCNLGEGRIERSSFARGSTSCRTSSGAPLGLTDNPLCVFEGLSVAGGLAAGCCRDTCNLREGRLERGSFARRINTVQAQFVSASRAHGQPFWGSFGVLYEEQLGSS